MGFQKRREHNRKVIEKDGMFYPARYSFSRCFLKAFLSPLKHLARKASMTVETALVLPLFLFCMFAVMQFAYIQIASSALLAGMHETAKEMAVYAYVQDIGVGTGGSLAGEIVAGGLSAAYAKEKVKELAGNAAGDGSFSLLQSSFLVHEMIDIVGTYQLAHSFTIFPVKREKALLRARVRAWTGREGRPKKNTNTTGGAEKEEEEDEPLVYVAATGSVYHKDPNCTHIRLSVSYVSKSSLSARRNQNGAKYHACEKCGASAGEGVYISAQGNRYHSSPECSGLKRTVRSCPVSEVQGMRACSRCGGSL